MKNDKYIFNHTNLNLALVLSLFLLFSVKPSMACDDVNLISGQKAVFGGFDTFSPDATRYSHPLQLSTIGDCQQLALSLGDRQGEPGFTPSFSVFSGTSELYNSLSTQGSQKTLILANPSNPLLIPLSFFVDTTITTPPGNKSKQLVLSITAEDSAGEQFKFEETLEIVIEISPKLSGGFSGTSVGQYSQNFDLDLGKLEYGKKSKKIGFVIQSNMKYDITVMSKNKGRLVLESELEGVSPSSLNYALMLDEMIFDLSSGSKQIQNLPLSKKTVGNSHYLYVWPTSDPTKTRAGIYTDTVVIEIQQRY